MKLFLLILNAACLLLASQTTQARHAEILIDAENGNVLHTSKLHNHGIPRH